MMSYESLYVTYSTNDSFRSKTIETDGRVLAIINRERRERYG